MEWIDINDRLPKEIGTYLVANNSAADIDIFGGTEFIKFNKQVTHWMKYPNPPKKSVMNYLISYGDGPYKRSLDLLEKTSKEIGKVDQFIRYTEEWLKGTKFWERHKFILTQARGNGMWLWKPFIIMQSLKKLGPDDVLIYTDAAVEVTGDLTPLFNLGREKERLIFQLPAHGTPQHKASKWTKGDCFSLMGCMEEKYWNADMCNGAISVWKNTEKNIEIMKEWIRWGKNPHIITDSPSMFAGNLWDFKDHRHDQSILSNMRVKYNWELFRDPSQFGEMDLNKYDNSTYGVLFNHHRKRL